MIVSGTTAATMPATPSRASPTPKIGRWWATNAMAVPSEAKNAASRTMTVFSLRERFSAPIAKEAMAMPAPAKRSRTRMRAARLGFFAGVWCWATRRL
jgi:hypothetical protein